MNIFVRGGSNFGGTDMLRKLIIFIFFSFSALSSTLADSNEIWVTPNSDEYSRLSSGLAGSFITIIDEKQISKAKNKNIAEIISSFTTELRVQIPLLILEDLARQPNPIH